MEKEKIVDIPLHIGRQGSASHIGIVLTQSQCCPDHEDLSRTNSSSSSNTLQVPDFSSSIESLDKRRRSLNSLWPEIRPPGYTQHTRRSSAPPNRRSSCGWGPVWELRKQFARRNRRLSSEDYQVTKLSSLCSARVKRMASFELVSICQFLRLIINQCRKSKKRL